MFRLSGKFLFFSISMDLRDLRKEKKSYSRAETLRRGEEESTEERREEVFPRGGAEALRRKAIENGEAEKRGHGIHGMARKKEEKRCYRAEALRR